MDSFEILMSGSSDDDSADDDDIPPTVAQELRVTNLGSNIAVPSQSDVPGILSAFTLLLCELTTDTRKRGSGRRRVPPHTTRPAGGRLH
jgi:hypothetical protein